MGHWREGGAELTQAPLAELQRPTRSSTRIDTPALLRLVESRIASHTGRRPFVTLSFAQSVNGCIAPEVAPENLAGA